jgi:23S rRNA pseudouridine2605 synthase
MKAEKPNNIRLNKFLANSGICSRRMADELIMKGLVTVNGQKVKQLGSKISSLDTVKYNNKVLSLEKHTYVLLNKPKDFLTTLDDPQDRKTVLSLVKNACKERIYPVGRLDRNTTGLLLLTNDGMLAHYLSHPSTNIKKVYQVELDIPITASHISEIKNGLELEDGKAIVDDIAVLDSNKKIIGLELHIGKNRIVRRIFEHLGYEVLKLDRTLYAGLTKKNLKRGEWRLLLDKEVLSLKRMCNYSKKAN